MFITFGLVRKKKKKEYKTVHALPITLSIEKRIEIQNFAIFLIKNKKKDMNGMGLRGFFLENDLGIITNFGREEGVLIFFLFFFTCAWPCEVVGVLFHINVDIFDILLFEVDICPHVDVIIIINIHNIYKPS